MYEVDHPAYTQLAKGGKEITSLKTDAIVALSAHCFYGFPDHYYKEKFPDRGIPELAQTVLAMIKGQGIQAEGVKRGLDHGIWACFKCAFALETNPLTVPIVQVSLPETDDPRDYVRLGQAILQLRSQNIIIVVTGMVVHNLRGLCFSFGSSSPQPYTASFEEALKTAVEDDPSTREKTMAGLLHRPDARKARPTLKHLIPIYMGTGAAGPDHGKRLWTLKEGSMSWAQYRFREVSAN